MLVKFKKLEEEEEEEDYVETATCGIRSSFSVLISGGEETAPGDWPWMALLRYSDPVMYVKIPADCETVSCKDQTLPGAVPEFSSLPVMF